MDTSKEDLIILLLCLIMLILDFILMTVRGISKRCLPI